MFLLLSGYLIQLESALLSSSGRLNDWHCECYEWTGKLEVNKSCVHAVPQCCNPAEWRVDARGAEIWSCQGEDTVTQPGSVVVEMWLN